MPDTQFQLKSDYAPAGDQPAAIAKLVAGLQRGEPHQVLLVVDGMAGQDALVAAKAFHARLPIDGVVLTKFDADPRRTW